MSKSEKQLTFLSDDAQIENSLECSTRNDQIVKIYIDGAARNNPGPAGAGIYIKRGDKILFEQGFFLGQKTNNQAEYLALIIGAFFIQEYAKKDESVLIYSDSQLLVRQMTGIYLVRDAILKKMQQIATELLRIYSVKFCHIYRQDNTQADFLANRGIDKKVVIPKKIEDKIREYNII
ncbi:ribonuclease HI family protein [Candidatus Dependentiae bacterium]|nr:ribonuclease HI family protein [Candidatus Dependentiae bacterium]